MRDFRGISETIMTEKTRKPTTGGVIIGSTYDEARTRKINAEAEIAELQLEKIKGTLCLTEDVVKAWQSVLHACRAKLLAVPSKISPVLAAEDDPAIVRDRLEDQIREALAELANYKPEIDPVNNAGTDAPEAAEEKPAPKRKRGRPRKAESLPK